MKNKIKQLSILLFEKKGFTETSIQDIVESLGVTKGTFYYYFESKEQLLMDIHMSYIDQLLERQRAIRQEHHSSRMKLEQIIALLIADIANHGPSGKVFFREMRHLSEDNAVKVKKKREIFRKNLAEIISEGIAQKEFRDKLEPEMVAFAILGVTNWSYQWFNPSGKISADQLARIYSDLILNGIA
ncbi:Transcriptional regulator, TetR family [Planococcus halocryophilus Or1]|uniref:TetR family transcriptional regulator n=1 Tax=Planococcus halocryophilus TaxID=1215089 RepID=A0A1C7DUH7_9BACL|nr:TetR/AcrR family transcriptional regulator [Planococcus halocryophilus]ANU14958.1 TetR family transcriptional regulator [Planococcus halocryophilus]EMF45629.1 Transcriptional regulator, TetR family [Planococcus halocryophilus Or1]